MPDLIIKPTATSGNKLILKDQAGGAVLTTADSGATLGNSTQDNITRLGTVTSGTLGSGVTGGSGLTGHGRIGDTARSYMTSTLSNQSGGTFVTGFTNDYIQNSTLFEHHADGIKVLIAGTYLVTWSIYTYSNSSSSPINENYSVERIAYKNNGTPDTAHPDVNVYYIRPHDGHADRYTKSAHANTVTVNANDVLGLYFEASGGNNYKIVGSINATFLAITYLSEHT